MELTSSYRLGREALARPIQINACPASEGEKNGYTAGAGGGFFSSSAFYCYKIGYKELIQLVENFVSCCTCDSALLLGGLFCRAGGARLLVHNEEPPAQDRHPATAPTRLVLGRAPCDRRKRLAQTADSPAACKWLLLPPPTQAIRGERAQRQRACIQGAEPLEPAHWARPNVHHAGGPPATAPTSPSGA